MLEPVDADVAGVVALAPVDVQEVAEDRRAGVMPVLLLQVEVPREQRLAARSVDQIAAGPAARRPLFVDRVRDRVRVPGKLDARDPGVPFQDLRALGGAVAQQQVVEFRAAHFVRKGMTLVQREREIEAVMSPRLRGRN